MNSRVFTPLLYHKFKELAIIAALPLLFHGGLSYADDTEIFFAQGASNVRPNVLFIIDDSGSMRNFVNGRTRWEITRDAVIDVIQGAEGVNVGIFNMYQQRPDHNCSFALYGANTVPLVEVKDVSTIRTQAINAVNGLCPMGMPNIEPQTLYHAIRYFSANSFHFGPPSPITSECQANYLVYSTDGQGNDLTKTMVGEITGSASCSKFSSYGDMGGQWKQRGCAATAVDWILNNDQHPALPGKQTITTHTMGTFGADAEALQRVASAGGGKYYDAGDSASGIKDAFNALIQDAIIENSVSFTNAAVSISSTNKNDDNEEIYYGLFKPEKTDRWAGNLKSYFLDIDQSARTATVRSSTLADTKGAGALKSDGEFKDDAMSRWSTAADGGNVTLGGAAFRLPIPSSRKLFVQIGNSRQELTPSNPNISNSRLQVANNAERIAALNYIRGLEADGITARKILGDPLHSTPTLFNYSCKNISGGNCVLNEGERMVVLGTNEGFVHMFDAKTGVEQWAFMPEDLLPNIKKLKDNATYTKVGIHPYGMDNTVVLWVNDVNDNGVIYGEPGSSGALNSGEFVYAYATMRRGGRGLYALDITQKNNPQLKWHIVGGQTAGFERLGQTWSEPVKTKVKVGATETDVLIFGGGYDDIKNDNDAPYRNGTHLGNSIYMVDAKSGALLWSASSSGGTLTLPDMQYSIPARVRVLEKDGLADQIFVGDTGGQVWRLFINNGNPQSTLVSAGGAQGVFARLGGTGKENARRFYHEADVTFTKKGGEPVLTVNIGSGYRAHPLSEEVKDRIYSLRTKQLTAGGVASLLTEHDLYDATSNSLDGSEEQAKAAMAGKNGWYMVLPKKGEKVLSTPLVVKGVVTFNSYVPEKAVGCSAAMGQNLTYRVRLWDASPATVAVGTVGSDDTRYTPSKARGIASSPILVRLGSVVGVFASPVDNPDLTPRDEAGQLKKSYWMDLSN